jgi:2-polyprenyl-3-methyl-5-hydroxy-6-metoxy-1,4-benzoquinol methylase
MTERPGRRVTVDQIDRLLASGDENFWVDFPGLEGLDPLSPQYREVILSHYATVAGHPYSTEYEEHPFDVGSENDFSLRPWPYATKDARLVGEQYQANGTILRVVGPKAGDRILELGCGWGNLTLPLALLDCDVTAVDIEPRYLRIVESRTRRNGLSVKLMHLHFLDIGVISDRFDLVLFSAAFHHCHDHLRLLGLVHERLADGGRLALCGEPLDEALPYAWGLNPTGEAMRVIRTFGWFETAFRVSYLHETLIAKGFEPTLHVCPETALGNVILAAKRTSPI